MRKKPLDKLNVRQAIELSLDKPKYLRLIYNNLASVATTALPGTIWSFNKNIKTKKSKHKSS